MDFVPIDPPVRPKPQQQRSRLDEYQPGQRDFDVLWALHDFRRAKTLEGFGRAVLQDLGPSVIMHDDTVQRIVDAAHNGKISNVDQLIRETRWALAHTLGEEVLSILQRFYPVTAAKPFSTRKPLQPRIQVNDATSSTAGAEQGKRRKCSACNGEDHICERILQQSVSQSDHHDLS